jgi:hypothetical protein
VAARAKEDREAAATAVFRTAECYRKLGKTAEATAAYNRVVSEFADQKKLAGESRAQLARGVSDTAPVSQAEARKKFREMLQTGMNIEKAYLDYVNQQVSLGAAREARKWAPEAILARLQAELSAFDAGLYPKLPASPRTAEARDARAAYRKSLVTAESGLKQNYEHALVEYKLGINQQTDVLRASLQLLDVQLQLAAFDAGLSYTPVAGAMAP